MDARGRHTVFTKRNAEQSRLKGTLSSCVAHVLKNMRRVWRVGGRLSSDVRGRAEDVV